MERKYPVGYKVFDPDDPASKLALPHIERADDPEIVVMGASMYGAVSECVEKYRRGTLEPSSERSMSLDTGTCFHAAVGNYYTQLKEQQK